MHGMTEMTIGRLADAAGVNVETIRYYQRRGLLLEPDRPINGQRRYARAVVKRVRFIKRAQVLGFTLDEVGSLLELDEAHACADTRELPHHPRTGCRLMQQQDGSGSPQLLRTGPLADHTQP